MKVRHMEMALILPKRNDKFKMADFLFGFVMAPRDFFVSCDMIQMCTDFRACTCNRIVGLEAQNFVGGAVEQLGHAPF